LNLLSPAISGRFERAKKISKIPNSVDWLSTKELWLSVTARSQRPEIASLNGSNEGRTALHQALVAKLQTPSCGADRPCLILLEHCSLILHYLSLIIFLSHFSLLVPGCSCALQFLWRNNRHSKFWAKSDHEVPSKKEKRKNWFSPAFLAVATRGETRKPCTRSFGEQIPAQVLLKIVRKSLKNELAWPW
jgi:hypothetical protein